ncbi:MAG: App1 family protein [Pirellulales bacterium]|nr:App1 family protein [Pirellulales bacterium]
MNPTRSACCWASGTILAGWLALGLPTTIGALEPVTNLKADERIVFYPTYGHLDPQAGVRLWIEGVVLESRHGAGATARLAQLFGLPDNADESALFRERVAHFLVDHERDKRVIVRVGRLEHEFAPTAADGVFSGEIDIEALAAAGFDPAAVAREQRLRVQAVLPDHDRRQFGIDVQLIGHQGWSVVCDIDDTVKVTQVNDHSELMNNTFFRPFRAVQGMPEALAAWRRAGAAFHYVSASPKQLVEPLAQFLHDAGLPPGSMHLRTFRFGGSDMLEVEEHHDGFKASVIARILQHFPERRFVLVGDSSQRDPEIYGKLARENPLQIAAIFIRNCTGEPHGTPRYEAAFSQISPQRWRVFDDPAPLALAAGALAP